jgi:hypothetical protein
MSAAKLRDHAMVDTKADGHGIGGGIAPSRETVGAV